MSNKYTDNILSPDDIMNIKKLLTYLNAIVDFLVSQKVLLGDLSYQFKVNRQNILRILNYNGLAIYFHRRITINELMALIKIIELGNEIIKIGIKKSDFLSNHQLVLTFHHLVKEITHDYERWINKASKI